MAQISPTHLFYLLIHPYRVSQLQFLCPIPRALERILFLHQFIPHSVNSLLVKLFRSSSPHHHVVATPFPHTLLWPPRHVALLAFIRCNDTTQCPSLNIIQTYHCSHSRRHILRPSLPVLPSHHPR